MSSGLGAGYCTGHCLEMYIFDSGTLMIAIALVCEDPPQFQIAFDVATRLF